MYPTTPILFVDSAATAHENAAILREALGVSADVCDRIATARARIDEYLPRILFVADKLPDGSGRELCVSLKAEGKLFRATPTYVICDEEPEENLSDYGIQLVRRATLEKLGAVELVRRILEPPSSSAPPAPQWRPSSRRARPEKRRKKVDATEHTRSYGVPPGERKVALVVDDEKGIRETLALILGCYGYESHSADGLNHAIDWLGSNTPEVFLVDDVMPDGNGTELTRRIRTMPQLRKAAVICFIHDGYTEDAAYAAGADLCLEKPVEPPTLLELISEVVAARSSRV